jgi:hypothetical protein
VELLSAGAVYGCTAAVTWVIIFTKLTILDKLLLMQRMKRTTLLLLLLLHRQRLRLLFLRLLLLRLLLPPNPLGRHPHPHPLHPLHLSINGNRQLTTFINRRLADKLTLVAWLVLLLR